MQSSNFVFCFMCTYETGYIKYTQISPSVNMNRTKIHNFFIYHCFCNSILFSETVTSLFRLMSGYIGLFRTFCRIAAITFLPPCIVKSAICNILRRISPFLFIFSAWQNLLPQLLFFPYCSKRFFYCPFKFYPFRCGVNFSFSYRQDAPCPRPNRVSVFSVAQLTPKAII